MTTPTPMTFATADAWEAWLGQHHTTAAEAWIAFPTRDTDTPSVTRREAWEVALCYGWIDGQALSRTLPAGWWALRFTPRRPRSRWSKVNCRKVEHLIAAGRMRPAGLGEVERARQDGRWADAYDPPSTATIPPDLERALTDALGGVDPFTALDARRRYHALNHIAAARRPDTRARRVAAAVALAANPNDHH